MSQPIEHPLMDPSGRELYAPACFPRRCPPMRVESRDGRVIRVHHGVPPDEMRAFIRKKLARAGVRTPAPSMYSW